MLTDRVRDIRSIPLVGCALAALALVGCDRVQPPSATTDATWEEQVDERSRSRWRRLTLDGADRGDESWEAIRAGSWAALPCERISLTVQESGYTFNRLEIVFERGGEATRAGGLVDWPDSWRGQARGEITRHEYARLCWLIERLELPRTSREWSAPFFHGITVELSWTDAEGRTVELSDYAGSGPPELAALRAAIESAALRLAWTPSPPAEPR